MREFDYGKLAHRVWNSEILRCVAKIHECKGRAEGYFGQKKMELLRLVEIAKIQSTEFSNKIEGIGTTSTRLKQLVADKTSPRNRSESEIVGYRDVLNTIHESYEYIRINPSYILQLHRDLLKPAGLSYGGNFKNVQNYIRETREDGSEIIRFIPAAPFETPVLVLNLCENYNNVLAGEAVDPLLLIFNFILDFLCIHPFNDGNGRMSRLLTLLLLYQNGYEVGKFISIEKQIEKTKDRYYDVLAVSSQDWQMGKNDPLPFIAYMLEIFLACYMEFEERLGLVQKGKGKKSAYIMVKEYVDRKLGKFTGADVAENCPGIGRASVLAGLQKLAVEGYILKLGAGRATVYVRKN